jgi:hypothetical protein
VQTNANTLELTLKNVKIIVKKRNSLLIPILAIENSNEWIETIEIPILILNNEEKIFPEKITNTFSSKNDIKITLKKENYDGMSLTLEISTNSQLYPWIHFESKVIFDKEREFKLKVPEIGLIPIPPIKNPLECVTIKQPTRHTPPTDEWKSN